MMHELPFQVDQLAEARSFQVGFRGAWFRCKIRRIREKLGEMFYLLEYVDYPDQKLEWIKVYQKPQHQRRKSKSRNTKGKLMVRPWYPTMYPRSQKPDLSTIFGVRVIVDTWKVGDLVDWWADGCYWSGRVAKILEDGKLKIDLLPPPLGEGLTYEVSDKDIRPSLDWCPKNGWTVPIPKRLTGGKQRPCAQLIKPEQSEEASNPNAADGKAVVKTSISTSLQHSSSNSSPCTEPLDSLEGSTPVNNNAETEEASNTNAADGKAVVQTSVSTSLERSSPNSRCTEPLDSLQGPIPVSNAAETDMALDVADTKIRKSSPSDSAASSQVGAESAEISRRKDMNGGLSNKKPLKKARKDRNICLDSKFLHSVEDKMLDLEELVNRVKWMKGILEFGMPLSCTSQSVWEFRPLDA